MQQLVAGGRRQSADGPHCLGRPFWQGRRDPRAFTNHLPQHGRRVTHAAAGGRGAAAGCRRSPLPWPAFLHGRHDLGAFAERLLQQGMQVVHAPAGGREAVAGCRRSPLHWPAFLAWALRLGRLHRAPAAWEACDASISWWHSVIMMMMVVAGGRWQAAVSAHCTGSSFQSSWHERRVPCLPWFAA